MTQALPIRTYGKASEYQEERAQDPCRDIAELERRITAALDADRARGRGACGAAAETADPTAMLPESDFAALNEDLDEERMLNAQLKERLRVVNAKHSAEVSALNAQIAEQGDEISRLRESIAA